MGVPPDGSATTTVNRRELVGVGAAACVACCVAPLLALLSGLGVVGLAGSLFAGATGVLLAGVIVTVAVAVGVITVRGRRTREHASDAPVPVQLTGRSS